MTIIEFNVSTMSIIQNIMTCMRGYRSESYQSGKLTKIKFGLALSKLSEKNYQHLPNPLLELLVYLAQEGIKTRDMFRRPGNSIQMKKIMEMMSDGIGIEWHNYNIYTVANVVKKYFISLPGGLFGVKYEMILLATHSFSDDDRRMTFLSILHQLPIANKELTILMFGILFRMVSHAVDEYAFETKNGNDKNIKSESECTESVLAEAVAKSVAGSIFHLCTSCPENVEKAAFVLRGLILDFPSFDEEFVDFYYRSTLISYGNPSSNIFTNSLSRNSVQCTKYLTDLTNTPKTQSDDIPTKNQTMVPLPMVTITNPCGDEETMSANSLPILKGSLSEDIDNLSLRSSRSSDYDKIQQRQLDMMRLRSDWFLNSGSCNNLNSTIPLNYDHYVSNEDEFMLSPDRHLQYQIVATSGPDILQSLLKCGRNRGDKTMSSFSQNLTVPNQYNVDSLQSSHLSSYCNNSRSSCLDEVYSDF